MKQSRPIPEDSEGLIAARMAALGIRIEDIEESFVRSGGHGGQNVNKTSTCVQLHHVPTGLRVKSQDTRYRGRNRLIAWDLLLNKLESQKREQKAEERSQIEKLRRQRRPRSRAAKQRILSDKAHNSKVKAARRSVAD